MEHGQPRAEAGLTRLTCGALAPKGGGRDASSLSAVVLAAYEPAKRQAERRCKRRQNALVDAFAGLDELNRAREDICCCRQFVDAVATRDAKAEDARRQCLYRRAAA